MCRTTCFRRIQSFTAQSLFSHQRCKSRDRVRQALGERSERTQGERKYRRDQESLHSQLDSLQNSLYVLAWQLQAPTSVAPKQSKVIQLHKSLHSNSCLRKSRKNMNASTLSWKDSRRTQVELVGRERRERWFFIRFIVPYSRNNLSRL
jgi:hypothetical protein